MAQDKGEPALEASTQSSAAQGRSPFTQIGPWIRARAGSMRLLALGFLCGAVVVSARSCSGGEVQHNHAAHKEQSQQDDPQGPKPGSWTCAMHPQIQLGGPGKCPICGMDLIAVVGSDASKEHDSRTRVTLSDRAKALAQVRTSLVRRSSDPSGEVRLLGRIEPNESTLKLITAWTGGRIDRLFVNTTGETVKAGQTIATLYSPEVFAAHQDLITAGAQVERMAQGAESSRRAAQAARGAARQRLALLGVPEDELDRMEKQEKPAASVAIRTPFGGTVMERFVAEGSYVATGARLYSIARLTSLWIQLDAYESDLPLLSLEQSVRIVVEAYPGEEFDGVVTFIDPTLDVTKRTAKVRVEVKNEAGRLRPGMFAQALVAAKSTEGKQAPLVVPATAPLFTGRRAIVYVEVSSESGSSYEARNVRLGPRLGSFYPVVAGLSENDVIVTRGAFALDADLQIRGGNSMMYSPDDTQSEQQNRVVQVPPSELRRLAPIVEAYLSLQRALADDDLSAGQAAASKLSTELVGVFLESSVEAKTAWDHFSKMLNEHAKVVAGSDSLEQARKGFEGLSGTMVMLLRVLGNPLDRPVMQAHCPMARGSDGASWIQEGMTLDNSYFGASMLDCGDIVSEIEPGVHLKAPESPPKEGAITKPVGGHGH